MKEPRKPPAARDLRARAEKRLAARQTKDRQSAQVDVDPRRLVHELEVHQIELELQNEALQAARHELEVGLARYTEFFDFAPIGYFVLASNGTIRELNLSGARLLGTNRKRLLGRRLAQFIAGGQRGAFAELLEGLWRGSAKESADCELDFIPDDGEPREVRVTAAVVQHPEPATLLAVQDISQRKRAQREQALLKRRFEILDRVSFSLSQKLAQNDPPPLRDLFQEVVEQARLACDAEYAALGIGEDPARPFHPWVYSGLPRAHAESIGQPPRPVGLLGEVIRTGRSTRLRDLQTHPSFLGFPLHHPKMTSFLGVVVPDGGRPVGHLYLANKVTQEEFSEDDQLTVEMMAQRAGIAIEVARLSADLRTAVTARNNLLAVVSHDLRSPLTAILLSTRLLLADARGPRSDPSHGRTDLDLIMRSAQRMSRLIDDLLQAATIEMQTFKVEAVPEAVAPMIEQALATIQATAARKSVRLEQTITGELPPVRCDRQRIEQVLSNLVENAIKFVHEGGTIRVTAGPAADGLQIAVSDDGPGIAAADLPYLFDRYWKGKGKGHHGLGLGLYIAKGIVEAHGGRIWVESQPGRGTSFYFTLPIVHDV